MADESTEEIALWLKQGLDAYGDGETENAIRAWRKVLAVDPQNEEALDFIESADRRDFPREQDSAGYPEETAQQVVIREARQLIAGSQLEESLELLQRAAENNEYCLELEATIELVRGSLYVTYREFVGDLASVPKMSTDPAEITKFNLPKNAGFLLSMVDGVTSLEDLMAVSGMDSFDALRTTKKLIEVGIVRMQP